MEEPSLMDSDKQKIPVHVKVVNPENGVVVNRFVVPNFLDRSGRQKIAKTAWWAMHNGYELRTRPAAPTD